ncbi:MAG TPA: four helix bundle protein [Chryseosolibacter sp.]
MEKVYDLEDRTEAFAANCRKLVRKLNRDVGNIEDGKQLVKSSGSVAANYIEANESLSDKDFVYRAKVCRKESKESRLWLRLLEIHEESLKAFRADLVREAGEFVKIFTSMINKFPPTGR